MRPRTGQKQAKRGDSKRSIRVVHIRRCALWPSTLRIKEGSCNFRQDRAFPTHDKRPARPPCRLSLRSGTVFKEAHMPGPMVCSRGDKREERCTCERYCTISKGQHKVRLCADGLYYCPDCREACDVALANSRAN